MRNYREIAEHVVIEVKAQTKKPLKIQYGVSPWSGRARLADDTGKTLIYFNWIKVPEPKSDISLYTFLHELGHIVAGKQKLSCVWEYLADEFAINQFKRFGIKFSKKLKSHHNWYVAYSLGQALNRGLRTIPTELKPFKKYLHISYTTFGDGRSKKVYRAIV